MVAKGDAVVGGYGIPVTIAHRFLLIALPPPPPAAVSCHMICYTRCVSSFHGVIVVCRCGT